MTIEAEIAAGVRCPQCVCRSMERVLSESLVYGEWCSQCGTLLVDGVVRTPAVQSDEPAIRVKRCRSHPLVWYISSASDELGS